MNIEIYCIGMKTLKEMDFEQLLNTENVRELLEEVQKVEGPAMEIQDAEMKKAVCKMKNGKASGPSDFQIEIIKVLGSKGEEWMLPFMRAICEEEVLSRDWEESQMVYLFKQKGDIMECCNHRGIKLTEHG